MLPLQRSSYLILAVLFFFLLFDLLVVVLRYHSNRGSEFFSEWPVDMQRLWTSPLKICYNTHRDRVEGFVERVFAACSRPRLCSRRLINVVPSTHGKRGTLYFPSFLLAQFHRTQAGVLANFCIYLRGVTLLSLKRKGALCATISVNLTRRVSRTAGWIDPRDTRREVRSSPTARIASEMTTQISRASLSTIAHGPSTYYHMNSTSRMSTELGSRQHGPNPKHLGSGPVVFMS